MKPQYLIFPFVFLLFSACASAEPIAQVPTSPPTQFTLPPVSFTATPEPTATLVPCDLKVEDFCLIGWNVPFQNPLGANAPLAVARSYPYGSTENGKRDPHHGVDLESKEGDPVHAAASGTVLFAGRDRERIYTPWDDYYGNLIVIQHTDDLFTLYGHLSQTQVSVGQQVQSGEVIGAVGHTGVAIGSHLHFEVRTGGDGTDFFSTENPELWLPLQVGMGALSIKLELSIDNKVQRQLVIYRYSDGTDTPEKKYYFATYPKGFEHNTEDFVRSDLPPGRYRIALTDAGKLYERIVKIEAGKLTQVVFDLKQP